MLKQQAKVRLTHTDILLRLIGKVHSNETERMKLKIDNGIVDPPKDKKIVEWFTVDEGLAAELADHGEVILGILWGRTTNSSFLDDETFNKIAKEIVGG